MRTFNPEAQYIITTTDGSKVQSRKFKNENALILFGRTLANKKKCTVYIKEHQAKRNSWQFFK